MILGGKSQLLVQNLNNTSVLQDGGCIACKDRNRLKDDAAVESRVVYYEAVRKV